MFAGCIIVGIGGLLAVGSWALGKYYSSSPSPSQGSPPASGREDVALNPVESGSRVEELLLDRGGEREAEASTGEVQVEAEGAPGFWENL